MGKQLLIKPEKCLGCRTCELVCSFGHNGAFNPSFANVSVLAYEEAAISVPMMCMQCEEPCCMEVCPVGAISVSYTHLDVYKRQPQGQDLRTSYFPRC